MTGATEDLVGASNIGNVPTPMGDKTFNLGITTIQWIATNTSGADTCSHTVEIVDTIPPTFTSSPLSECVDLLNSAVFTVSNPNPNLNAEDNLILNPSPDQYTFVAGDDALDLSTLYDNCCDSASMIINWRIDFSDTTDPLNPPNALSHSSISSTGQPSTYGSDILFPGDGVFFTTITHTITYWVVDCNGNVSETQTQNIGISPRPDLIKQN